MSERTTDEPIVVDAVPCKVVLAAELWSIISQTI